MNQPHTHSVFAHRHPKARRIHPARAVDWLAAGWRMFIARPFTWLLMALVAFVVMALVSTLVVPLPVVGPMAAPILMVLFIGGMLSAAERQAHGQAIGFENLFDGLRRHLGNLTLVGVFYSIPLVLMSLVTVLALTGGLLAGLLGTALGGALSGLLSGAMALVSMIMTGWVFVGVFFALMILALICAPALVMYRGTPSFDAMRLSLGASVRNLGATLLFGLMIYTLFLIALIPAGLGILVLIPVGIGALREAYLDMFGEDDDVPTL
ncbi:MAG: BPSS1780 family membrane protein [Rhodocyclaceae bacterium]